MVTDVYWTAKEMQMFVQIHFNYITTKNSFMINEIRAKRFFGHLSFKLYSLVQSNAQQNKRVTFFFWFNTVCDLHRHQWRLGTFVSWSGQDDWPRLWGCCSRNGLLYIVAVRMSLVLDEFELKWIEFSSLCSISQKYSMRFKSGLIAGHTIVWDVLLMQEVLCNPCWMCTCIILLENEVRVGMEKWYHMRLKDLINVTLCSNAVPPTRTQTLEENWP